MFLSYFPDPNQKSKKEARDHYGVIKAWFSGGNQLELLNDDPNAVYASRLDSVAGLAKVASSVPDAADDMKAFMELVLFGLTESEVIGKNILENSLEFSDPLADMFQDMDEEDEE